jgi:DNA polymerase-3 subunit delta'
MLFEKIIGQENVKKQLIQTVAEKRISHAQLFLGPEGCGNLGLAIAYAQYISCENRNENDACGICSSCQKYEKLIHPDLHFVYPVASTKTVTKDPVSNNFIDDWRSAILDNPYMNLPSWYETIGIENKQGLISRRESYEIIKILSLKTFESEFKVMVIWMPEKMNQVAANKLLKILEEPPPNTIFILVSETTDQILPTILSRTQIVKIPGIDNKSVMEALELTTSLNDGEKENVVRLANGNYYLAQKLIHERESQEFHFDTFTSMMRLCYGGKIPETIRWVDNLAGLGREKQKQYLTYAMRLIRENFMMNMVGGSEDKVIYLTKKEEEFSRKFAPFIKDENIHDIVDELNKSHQHISANANSKIVLLDLCLKIMKLIKM